MGMAEVLTVIDKLGLPVGLLVVIGFAIRKVAMWLAPRVDKVVDAHVGFVNGVAVQVERQNDILETQTGTMRAVADGQVQQGKLIEDIHRKHFTPVVVNTGPTTVNQQKKSDGDHSIVIPQT